MCGLVGAVGQRDVMPTLLAGLKILAHQEHDSAGLGFLQGEYRLDVRRCVGPLSELESGLQAEGLSSPIGIGHMRRATHGAPERRNAHPQVSHRDIAVVHNGVIENHAFLRKVLEAYGYRFRSDTDTEVVAHLVHHQMKLRGTLFEAVQAAAQLLTGAYAIAVMAASEPDVLVAVRHARPLAIGIAPGERYVVSDPEALLATTRQFIFPEDGDVAELSLPGIRMADAGGRPVVRPVRTLGPSLPKSAALGSGLVPTSPVPPPVLMGAVSGAFAAE